MSQELFNIKKFQTRNDLLAADNRPASHLQELKNATFTELGAITSINGNQVEPLPASIYSSAPDGDATDASSCYWDSNGKLNADTLYLFGTHIGIKFPMGAFTGLTADEVILNLTLGSFETTSFSGNLYLATSEWDNTTAVHPTYNTDTFVPIFLSNPGETKPITIPNEWLTTLNANEMGFVIVTDTGITAGIESFSITYGFGTGADGDITVSSPNTNVKNLTGTYDPQGNFVINAKNITIISGASLIVEALGTGTGIVYLNCQGKFINYGTVQSYGYTTGLGSGGAPVHGRTTPGVGGVSYGVNTVPNFDTTISSSEWILKFGSGGASGTTGLTGYDSESMDRWAVGAAGGGGGGHSLPGSNGLDGQGWSTCGSRGEGGGGAGGTGGGIIVIRASSIENSGIITSSGGAGGGGGSTGDGAGGGGGGGGSAGTIYLEATDTCFSSGSITAIGGVGGGGGYAQTGSNGGSGGAGSVGRIFIRAKKTIASSNPSYLI